VSLLANKVCFSSSYQTFLGGVTFGRGGLQVSGMNRNLSEGMLPNAQYPQLLSAGNIELGLRKENNERDGTIKKPHGIHQKRRHHELTGSGELTERSAGNIQSLAELPTTTGTANRRGWDPLDHDAKGRQRRISKRTERLGEFTSWAAEEEDEYMDDFSQPDDDGTGEYRPPRARNSASNKRVRAVRK
jgi:hypothetical protein